MKILSAAGFVILVIKWLGYLTQVSYWFPVLLIFSPLILAVAIFLLGAFIVGVGALLVALTRR